MLHALLTFALAQQPMASDDAAERLAAVAKWVKKQKTPQLSAKDARALTDCVELPAVKDTGCELGAQLCPLPEGDDGSSGTRVEALSLLLRGSDGVVKPLRVWWIAAYEPRLADCDPPESLLARLTPEQRAKEVSDWKRAHAREHAKCVAGLERDVKNDAEELRCDVVLVNACRREAYVTCKARNLRKSIAAVEPLHRFEF